MKLLPPLLLASLAGAQSDPAEALLEAQRQALRVEPGFESRSWIARRSPSFAPFVLLVEKDSANGEAAAAEAEKAFGPALTAMAKAWKAEWAEPLQLVTKPEPPCLTLALLSHFELYKDLIGRKLPPGATVPPTYAGPKGLRISYHRGPDFESKTARRQAILDAAAEMLVELHAASGEGKRGSAWTRLGMGAYVGEIQTKTFGPKGTQYFRAEIPTWKQDLPALADSLTRADVALPDFSEILSFESAEEIARKATALAAAAGKPETEIVPLYRNYVRLCGYSLLLFFRSKAGEPYQKAFYAFLKDDFRGAGGFERLKEAFGSKLAEIEKGWESFCEWKPPAVGPHLPGKTSAKADPAAAALPPPVPLDLEPRTMLELRAELIARIRGRRFDEALALLEDPKLREIAEIAPRLDAEKKLFASPRNLYLIFGKQWKPGDRFPSGFGPNGEIAKASEEGFEIRGKNGAAPQKWRELDLRAVANYVVYNLKYGDQRTSKDVGVSLLLAGEAAKAKKFLEKAAEDVSIAAESKELLDLVAAFDAAGREASAREEVRKIAAADPRKAIEPIRKLLVQAGFKESATFPRSKPYLLGLAAQSLASQFEEKGMQGLFRGKASRGENGKVAIRYSFKDAAELQDWTVGKHSFLAELFKVKKDAAAEWSCEGGVLRARPTGALYHNAFWTGEIALEYTVEAESPDAPLERATVQLLGGICDDGKGNFAATYNFFDLVRYWPGKRDHHSTDLIPYLGREYRLRIALENGRLSVQRDGEETASAEEKKLADGRVFLFAIGSVSFKVQDLTISGSLDPRWIEQQRTGWIRKELQSIFGSL